MIGQILKGYRVVEKIKDGSVGTVWRAVDAQERVVALKQISEKNAQISRKIRGFKREATLTQRLKHPNVIQVYEHVDGPRPFFIMEYFDSENLKFAMWHCPDRVFKHEFSILRKVADAIAYIHSQGVVHRDLKPENVLISPASDVRLIDFSLGQTRFDRFLQFGRRVEGTPLYMSPEQVQGLKCDERTDIYAFGILMFELLTKRPPFLGTTEKALLEKHVKDPAPPMRNFVRTMAPELDDLVARMLSQRPEDRFPDMTSVIYELGKWEKKDTVVRMRQVEPARRKNSAGEARP
jgi:serine/threonine protein kinase